MLYGLRQFNRAACFTAALEEFGLLDQNPDNGQWVVHVYIVRFVFYFLFCSDVVNISMAQGVKSNINFIIIEIYTVNEDGSNSNPNKDIQ